MEHPAQLAAGGSERQRTSARIFSACTRAAESRWRGFLEVRDTVRETLAPALPLPHLLTRGSQMAKALQEHRPRRPRQIARLEEISLG